MAPPNLPPTTGHATGPAEVQNEMLYDTPVTWVTPESRPRGYALWLTHLGGSTKQTEPMLSRVA
jgi:hypothetical protein